MDFATLQIIRGQPTGKAQQFRTMDDPELPGGIIIEGADEPLHVGAEVKAAEAEDQAVPLPVFLPHAPRSAVRVVVDVGLLRFLTVGEYVEWVVGVHFAGWGCGDATGCGGGGGGGSRSGGWEVRVRRSCF